jgi:hypothetical protein
VVFTSLGAARGRLSYLRSSHMRVKMRVKMRALGMLSVMVGTKCGISTRQGPAFDTGPVVNKSFLEQLHDTRTSRATDPRDKVFALAKMTSAEERSSLNRTT